MTLRLIFHGDTKSQFINFAAMCGIAGIFQYNAMPVFCRSASAGWQIASASRTWWWRIWYCLVRSGGSQALSRGLIAIRHSWNIWPTSHRSPIIIMIWGCPSAVLRLSISVRRVIKRFVMNRENTGWHLTVRFIITLKYVRNWRPWDILYSQGDAEVLLKSYIHWGEKCLDRFIGMFAFVIYDGIVKKIFWGEIALVSSPCVIMTRKCFCRASEEKQIIDSGLVSLKFDEEAIGNFLYTINFTTAKTSL